MKLAVFASGGGSNFQAIVDAISKGRLSAEVVLLVSDRRTAGALDRARSVATDTAVIHPDHLDPGETFGGAILAELHLHEVTHIALAGYLKMVPAEVVNTFRNRIVNVHPSLLPSFGGAGLYGRRVHEAVLAHGVRWTGATVHFVDESFDTGPIILQEPVAVLQEDSWETLADRVLEVEHRIYPEALNLLAEGRLSVEGRRVIISE